MFRGYVGTSLDGKSVECVHPFPREVLEEGNSELYFVGRLTLLEKDMITHSGSRESM